MSYDDRGFYFWSGADDEGYCISPPDPYDESSRAAKNSLEHFRLAITHLKTHQSVKNKLLKTILNGYLNNLSANYAHDEQLPFDYLQLAKTNNALPILIKSLLSKYISNEINDDHFWGIEYFSESIYENDNLDSVYSRVGDAQRYIHKTLDEHLGEGFSETMPGKDIRCTLSAMRLHLFLHEYKRSSYIDIARSIKGDLDKSRLELFYPQTKSAFKSKRYIKRWSYKHLMPLTEYDDRNNLSEKIIEISECGESLPIDQFKEYVLEEWSDELLGVFWPDFSDSSERQWCHKHRRWK
ncbi:hypothetical protein N8087_00315 [Porticoccaceae bacterium]|nr:hypothetical protein [Porticoccaceae bacterium]